MNNLVFQQGDIANGALKLINMRTVHDLIAVECIAELYNRYESSINHIRFTNVDVIWSKGIVTSYAPVLEWENIKKHISKRFLAFDFELIKNLALLYTRRRVDSRKFINSFLTRDISSYTDFELINLLEKYQSLVFGDLYRLNFVQIEHGLSSAIELFLKNNYEEFVVIRSQQAISNFIFTTAAGTENQSLKKKAWIIKAVKLFNNSFLTSRIYSLLLEKHHNKFSHLYCGYGELPKTKDFFERRINEECFKKTSLLEFLKLFTPYSFARNFIHNVNCSLEILCSTKSTRFLVLVLLQFFGGKFRDTNKAILGTSTIVRLSILDEVARRGYETRENLRFYSFEELYTLITKSKRTEYSLLSDRKTYGVHLRRTSSFGILEKPIDAVDVSREKKLESIFGVCASRGFARGACKVIFSKEDIFTINDGDIMIAIGTDFDLIEGMYKASAIITEEGGLLSHAAVICRELKKPCVIGVKNATSIFTNNLIVEVSADEGKIEIIKDR